MRFSFLSKPRPAQEEKEIREIFVVGITLKAVGAFFETVLGLLLMFTNVVTSIVFFLMRWSLVDDPDNYFISHLHSLATLSAHAQFLGGVYLLSHGIVKLFLMIAVLLNKVWAYPASIGVLALFMIYEIVRYVQTFSVPTGLLFLFDGIIVILLAHEYLLMRKQKRSL